MSCVGLLLAAVLLISCGDGSGSKGHKPISAKMVERLRSSKGAPVYWLGRAFAGYRLDEFTIIEDQTTTSYGACVEFDPGSGCSSPVDVSYSKSDRETVQTNSCPRKKALRRFRGALAEFDRRNGSVTILTGHSDIGIQAKASLLKPAARRVWGINRKQRPGGPLPPPARDHVCLTSRLPNL